MIPNLNNPTQAGMWVRWLILRPYLGVVSDRSTEHVRALVRLWLATPENYLFILSWRTSSINPPTCQVCLVLLHTQFSLLHLKSLYSYIS